LHILLSSTWKKIGINGTVHQLFTDFKKTYDSVTRATSYTTLEFGILTKLINLKIMYSQEDYREVWIGKYLSSTFPI
jgi:hypothetical protein